MPGEVLNFEPEPRVTFGTAGDRIEAVIVAPEGHHLHAFGTAAVARGWARALLALADAIDPQPRVLFAGKLDERVPTGMANGGFVTTGGCDRPHHDPIAEALDK